jgi:hypothetical protein
MSWDPAAFIRKETGVPLARSSFSWRRISVKSDVLIGGREGVIVRPEKRGLVNGTIVHGEHCQCSRDRIECRAGRKSERPIDGTAG